MNTLLEGLNAAQKEAVTSKSSVIQVLAPPGSGKTKTLTSRVAYLLAHHGYNPQNVICCTFTIKASREMRERLRAIVGRDLESKLILGTFHSICRRYLVTYGHLIGIPSNFGIADSNDSLGIIKRLQKKMKFSLEPRVARNKISHQKARGQRVEDLIARTKKSVENQEFIMIFQEYEDALSTSNLLDYDDLLLKCVELLKQHPQCVSNIEALLIDEFQDTNNVQFELMKLLASAKKRVTIVGDPDQSIYGFRSAEIENLRRMQQHYPETMVINLEENYRSSSAVLHLAQDVIEQDEERPSKRLKSTHCYGTLPVLRRLPNPHEEAVWIVSEIKRITRMTAGCVEYSDIAILLRSAFLSLLIEKSLANVGIPYKMVGGSRFFDRVEVRILLDYLRTINHPDNNSALLSIINTPARKIGDGTVAELNRAAEKAKLSLWNTIQKVAKGDLSLEKKLAKPAEQGLHEFVSLVKKGQEELKSFEPAQAPGQLIELVAKKLNFRDYLKRQYQDDWEDRWENVKELCLQAKDTTLLSAAIDDQLPEIDGLKQGQGDGAQEMLTRFLANVALSTEVESEKESVPISRITISTIHSAKGLEWPIVFVPALYEGSIPHSRAEDTSEERRLLYVAMTRAKALLYMTFPAMQSRDESESILTQFLPRNLDHRLKDVGPIFDDKTIQDITSILSRPLPLQADLAKAVNSLQDHESQYDDIWPADGSARSRSTYAATKFNIRQEQNASAESHPGVYAGFTTASHQLSTMPIQNESTQSQKTPKLVKSTDGQGSIATFFGKANAQDLRKEKLRVSQSQSGYPSRSAAPTTKYSSIPVELTSHRVNASILVNSANQLKRPHTFLAETSENGQFPSKRPYACFSSSPTREQPISESNTVDAVNDQHLSSTTRCTTISSFQQKQARSDFGTYNSGMLNTLSKPAPLTNMTGTSFANSTIKKTLGVRRSMTGWADRKNR